MTRYNYFLEEKQANKVTIEDVKAYLKVGHFFEKFKSKYSKILHKKKN